MNERQHFFPNQGTVKKCSGTQSQKTHRLRLYGKRTANVEHPHLAPWQVGTDVLGHI